MIGFTCPKCGADTSIGVTSLDGWDDDLANGCVFVDMTCPSCKTEFTNVYTFDHQETTYTEEEVYWSVEYPVGSFERFEEYEEAKSYYDSIVLKPGWNDVYACLYRCERNRNGKMTTYDIELKEE